MYRRSGSLLSEATECTVNTIHAGATVETKDRQIKSRLWYGWNMAIADDVVLNRSGHDEVKQFLGERQKKQISKANSLIDWEALGRTGVCSRIYTHT